MTINAGKTNKSAAANMTLLHGKGNETHGSNKNVNSKQHMTASEKVPPGQEEHDSLWSETTSTTNTDVPSSRPPPSPSPTISRNSTWLKQLGNVALNGGQRILQHITTNSRKPDRPSTNFINWSYRLLRRKQLIFFIVFVIFIFYLSCSIRSDDYADERIPVLHYSHVPGMKENNLLPSTAAVLPLTSTIRSILKVIKTSIVAQKTTTKYTEESSNDSHTEILMNLNNDTNNSMIIRPPTGYLVWSDYCRIPDIDVHSPDIMQYFKREKFKPCSNKKPLTTVQFNSTSRLYILQIEENLIKTYSKSGRIHCCYQAIIRNGTGEKADEDYRLEKCIPFKKSIPLPSEIDNILVQCDSNKRNVYKNGHALISERPEVTKRLNSWKQKDKERTGTKPHSVLMIGIDSISRVNLIRSMPKTAQHLYDNDWFELTGYNKIDDNTFPNFMALLAGYNRSITAAKCPPKIMGALDNCSLIWNTFREHGYVTGYGEDAAEISTFNYYKAGFTKPPVDYYLRPFQLAAEHNLYKTIKSGLTFCLGYQQSAQFVLDYALEFATRYKDDPLFGLFWANSFSHNSLSDSSSMDNVMLSYLERLSTLGLLERMTIIFFSDHGLRFGPARTTVSGHMEERLPFIFIWLPSYLKQKYPSFVNALSVNKNRLTTPYDLHMTLKHFLKLSKRVEEKERANVLGAAEACENCQTLLEPIPMDRSCNDAAIEEHWCTCIPYNKVNQKMSIVQKLGEITVNHINKLVKDFRNGTMKSICRNLHLKNVVSAYRSHEAFRPKDIDGSALDVYRLQLITKPNGADFEVTLRYNPKTEAFTITGEISRLDSYLKDSHCIKDSYIKKYCSCA